MLKPSPARGSLRLSGLFGNEAVDQGADPRVSRLTFGSFDQFDLNDGLQHGSAAPHIQSDDGTSNLQGLHRLAVGNFGHV